MATLIRRRGQPESPGGGLYFTSPKTNLQFIHSGCALLDCVLGGGWPLGRVSNIVGDKSTGKTLLAIEACANFLRKYQGDVLYVEAEAAFDPEYAAALGLPMQRIALVRDIGTVEEFFEAVGVFIGVDVAKGEEGDERKLRQKPGLIVLDSLDALSDKAESGRAIDEGSYGATKARKLSELFRRLVRPLEKTSTHTMIISQVRDNIGVTFGRKHTRSGGRALDFYASQILWLAHIQTLSNVVNKQKRATGVTIKAKLDKCKIGFPFRECEFDLRFGYGIEDLEACVKFLDSLKKAGRVPALKDLRRMRGTELRQARELLGKVVAEEWYALEKQFAPTAGKYQE